MKRSPWQCMATCFSAIALATPSTACLLEEVEEDLDDVRELESLDELDDEPVRDDEPLDDIVEPQRKIEPDSCGAIDEQPTIPDQLTAKPDTAENGSGKKCCTSPNGGVCSNASPFFGCVSCPGTAGQDNYIECEAVPGCSNPFCTAGWYFDGVSWSCHGRSRFDQVPACDGLNAWMGCEPETCD